MSVLEESLAEKIAELSQANKIADEIILMLDNHIQKNENKGDRSCQDV